MREKIISVLNEFAFDNQYGDSVQRYILLAVRDGEIDVVDREAGYTAYTCTYTVAEDETIVIDFENKVEKSIGAVEKVEDDFDLNAEIETTSFRSAQAVLAAYESDTINALNEQVNTLNEELSALRNDYAVAQAKIQEYEDKEEEVRAEQHKAEVDQKVDEYADKMGQYSEYLLYKARIDYSKTVEQVDVDMTLMYGNYMKGKPSSKFSYQPISFPAPAPKSGFESKNSNRYGDLFDKVKK